MWIKSKRQRPCAAKSVTRRNLCMLSVLPNTGGSAYGNATGHALTANFLHVHPPAAMPSLTGRKLLRDGCARIAVTHRALGVAKRDLITVTIKTIQ